LFVGAMDAAGLDCENSHSAETKWCEMTDGQSAGLFLALMV
jgi:hypothetical protein